MEKGLKELKAEAGMTTGLKQSTCDFNQFVSIVKSDISKNPSIVPTGVEKEKLLEISKSMEDYGNKQKRGSSVRAIDTSGRR